MAKIEFDDDLVLDLIEQSKGRSLRKVGFATRQTAMESIVDGVGPSQPGSPPNSHTGVLRRSIRYDYDQITSTMTAGPDDHGTRSRRWSQVGNHTTLRAASCECVRGRSCRQRLRMCCKIQFRKFLKTLFIKDKLWLLQLLR